MSPFLIAFSLFAALHITTATTAADADATNEYLDPHNQARAAVGVAPLTWSRPLAGTAARVALYQRIKFRCQFANLTGGSIGGKYGVNQLWAGGMEVTPRAAVDKWVAEKEFYDHARNACVAGNPRCGVYTQVVWGKSTELGCAQATCTKEQSTLTICLYYPPGNVVGESPY